MLIALMMLIPPCALIAFCVSTVVHNQAGIHKLVMPGKYSFSLKEDKLYGVWYFWKCPSQGINQDFKKVNILVENRSSTPIEHYTFSYPGPPTQSFLNIGREEYSIKANEDCTIDVTCDEKCVIVFAPVDSLIYQPELNILSFYGSFDDLNFDRQAAP